jgi:hypothetical protein
VSFFLALFRVFPSGDWIVLTLRRAGQEEADKWAVDGADVNCLYNYGYMSTLGWMKVWSMEPGKWEC